MDPRPADVPRFIDLKMLKSPLKLHWSGDGHHQLEFNGAIIPMVMKLETTQLSPETPLPVIRLEILAPNLEIVTKSQETPERSSEPIPVIVEKEHGELVLDFLRKSAEDMDRRRDMLVNQRQVCHEG